MLPVAHKILISKIIPETRDAASFQLDPVDWQPVYQAGQFITILFKTPHGEKRRSFSFSSSPESGEALQITVKKLDNGEFSRQLLYTTKAGDELIATGIGGFFILPPDTTGKQFFFLAAGSGITPCFSLIKSLLITTTEPVILIYSNRSKEDTIFYDQLVSLRDQYPERFTIRFLLSNLQDVYNSRLSNWLLLQLLDQYIRVSLNNCMFYICGPNDYMLMAAITLKGYGILHKNIIKENYDPLPRAVIPKPPDTGLHQVTILAGKEQFELSVQYPDTILAAAKKKKLSLPYSCEAGRCGSCVALCTKGKIWMAYNEVLMDDELENGLILTCQAFPIEGDVVIRI